MMTRQAANPTPDLSNLNHLRKCHEQEEIDSVSAGDILLTGSHANVNARRAELTDGGGSRGEADAEPYRSSMTII
jgi:hypothetical protein